MTALRLLSITIAFGITVASAEQPARLHSATESRKSVVMIGVLEEVQQRKQAESTHAVRVLFRKVANDWVAFPSDCSDAACLAAVVEKYPPEVKWTITFDGRQVGTVKSFAPTQFDSYSHVGLETLESQPDAPVVGSRTNEYSGYLGAPVYRPLIAVSVPNFVDPEKWKPAVADLKLRDNIRQQFRKQFPNGTHCDQEDPTDERPLVYSDANIKITKAYASTLGSLLVRTELETFRCGTEITHEFPNQWFVVQPTGRAKYLGHGLQLVDAGDYDNDGHSELVFSIAAENVGGYELFYDDFAKRTSFVFKYH